MDVLVASSWVENYGDTVPAGSVAMTALPTPWYSPRTVKGDRAPAPAEYVLR